MKGYQELNNYVHDFSLAFREGHIYMTLLEENLQYLQPPVLHIGCNAGSTTALIGEYVDGPIVGYDINEEAIRKASQQFKKKEIEFRHGNLLSLLDDFAYGSFNTVVAFDVLEHIYPHEIGVVMENLRCVLGLPGYLLLFLPRCGYDTISLDTAYDDAHLMHFFNAMSVRSIVEPYGFKVVSLRQEKRANPDQSIAPGSHDSWFCVVKR